MKSSRLFTIRTKLLLPGLTTLALLFALTQWLWIPWQTANTLTNIETEQHLKLHILNLSLIEPLLSGDFGHIYKTLDAVIATDPAWQQLQLTDPNGKQLYPLAALDETPATRLMTVTKSIDFGGASLAHMTLHFDSSAKLATEQSKIQLISLIVLGFIAVGLMLNFILQDWLIRRPLEEMAAAARVLARGQFDQPIHPHGHDEIGLLAATLESMRTQLRTMTDELRQSKQRLLAIVTDIPDGIFTVLADGTIESVNAAACTMFGYNGDELKGRNVNILIPPKQRHHHANWMASAEHRSRVVDQGAIPTHAVRRGEQLFPAEFKISEIKGQDDTLYLVLVRDITERTRAEQALRAAMTVMEREKNTIQAIFLGTTANSSDEVIRLSAMTAAKALEADAAIVTEIIDPSLHRAQTLAVWRDGAFQENFACNMDETPCALINGRDYVCVPKDARKLYPECQPLEDVEAFLAIPFFNSQGVTIGHMAILFHHPLQDEIRSISIMKIFATRLSAELERSAAERTREEQARHTHAILDNLVEGIITIDEHGIVSAFNHAAETIFGYSASEVLNRNVNMLMPEPERAQHDSYLNHYLTTGEKRVIGMSREVTGLRKSGTTFLMELQVSQISRAGRPVFIGVVRDITERKSAETERQRLQRQLAQAQKMEAIGQLTGGVAHDFNNMLAGILGFTELSQEIAQEHGYATLSSHLAQIYRAGERARDLVAKMLAFSRGRDANMPEPVLLSSAIPEMLTLLRPVLPASIVMKTELDTSAPAVLLDTIGLQQVVLNLCINARDAMDGAGSLLISVHKLTQHNAVCSSCHLAFTGDYVELCISDSGPGMDAATQQRVFEPFYTTKPVGKGTGMGLAMVHGIVHEGHGHIVLESDPGTGSRFRLLFSEHNT